MTPTEWLIVASLVLLCLLLWPRLKCWAGLHRWEPRTADWMGAQRVSTRFVCRHCGRAEVRAG